MAGEVATTDRLRGVEAIIAALGEHGIAFSFDRHQVYRLSQRADDPLPVDGPVGMPIASRLALEAWVERQRRRGNRRSDRQLALFE